MLPVATPEKPVMHFIWVTDRPRLLHNEDVPFTVLASMLTFHLHHPDVPIYFHTNIKWLGYRFDRLPATLVPVDMSTLPFKITHSSWQVHYADYYRFFLMAKYGGIYLDCNDTITLESLLDLYAKANVLTYRQALHDGKQCFNVGFLMCNHPDTIVSTEVLKLFETQYTSFFDKYNSVEYYLTTRTPELDLIALEPGTIEHFYKSLIPCRVAHFYRSGISSGGETTFQNYTRSKTLYAQVLREALRRANGHIIQ